MSIAVIPYPDVTTSVTLNHILSGQRTTSSREAAAHGILQACQKGQNLAEKFTLYLFIET